METKIEPGNLVEWYSQSGGIRLGIVSNIPPVRRIGQVSHVGPEFAVVHDPDGIRAVVPVGELTILRDRAFPGWAAALGHEH